MQQHQRPIIRHWNRNTHDCRTLSFLKVPWWDTCWDNFGVLSFVTRLLWGISFARFTTNSIVSLVTRICDSYWCMSPAAKAVLGFPSIKRRLRPLFPISYSSAPPAPIEISTPCEIIMRVSSASDLPHPWQPLGGLSRLHLFLPSGPSGFPSLGLWIPSWFSFVFVEHARVDVPTLYPPLREASCLAICTIGNPLFLMNMRLLALGYR